MPSIMGASMTRGVTYARRNTAITCGPTVQGGHARLKGLEHPAGRVGEGMLMSIFLRTKKRNITQKKRAKTLDQMQKKMKLNEQRDVKKT